MPDPADRNGHVYLVSAARTPIGKFGGRAHDVPATSSAASRSGPPSSGPGWSPGAPIDEVFMGQVLQGGAGQAPARQARSAPACPTRRRDDDQPRLRVGLKAIMLAAAVIRAGEPTVVVAGGMEKMNRRPYLLPKARFGYRLGNGELVDSTVADGLWCAIEDCHMGTHAERVAVHDDVAARRQDAFALESHRRAIAARMRAGSPKRCGRCPSAREAAR